MSYTKQNFKSGDILYASQLNAMDNEISTLEAEVNSTKNMVGHPYTATTASAMSDQTKIYVYTGNETGYTAGHWYYHNGTAWTDGGVYNSVAVNTDTSLTVSGQAADSKAVGDAIDEIDGDLRDVKNDLKHYGFKAVDFTPSNGTHNGVTFTWSNGVCTLTGAQTGAAQNVLFSRCPLPEDAKPGDPIKITYTTSDTSGKLSIYVEFYDSNNTQISSYAFTQSVMSVLIPANATQWRARVFLASNSGVTLPQTITTPIIMAGGNTENFIQTMGVLRSMDLDDLRKTGIWSLTSSNTYTHSPIPSTSGGTIEVVAVTENTIIQRVYRGTANTDEVWWRKTAIGVWDEAWHKIATLTDVDDKLDAPQTAGEAGQVLTSDGQGGQSWEDSTGGSGDFESYSKKITLAFNPTTATHNGITFTWSNGVCTLTGTQTGASQNVILDRTNLPSDLKPGDAVKLIYDNSDTAHKANIVIDWYTSSSSTAIKTDTFNDTNQNARVPTNAARWRFRILAPSNSGVTLPVTIGLPTVFFDKTLKVVPQQMGILESCDLNNVRSTGIWSMTSGNTYAHSPIASSSGGILEVIAVTDNTILQRAYRGTAGTDEVYWRKTVVGTWDEWNRLADVTENNYTTEHYENTYNIECAPTITTDTNNYLAPSGDTTDRTAEIEALLATGVCRLGSGTYYVSGVDIPSYAMLIGSGARTKLVLKDSVTTGYAVKLQTQSCVKDLRLAGVASGTYTPSVTVGTRHGILFEGTADQSSPVSYARSTIENVIIHDFNGGGITCYNTGGVTYRSLNISDIHIYNCDAGINISYYSEFHRICNFNITDCYYGVICNGGNCEFVNGNVSSNMICILMDNSQGQSRNHAHGVWSNCKVCHSGSNNDGVLFNLLGLETCQNFNGMSFDYGEIIIDDCEGIVFTGSRIGKGTTITITDSIATIFDACIVRDASEVTVSVTNSPTTHFNGCYTSQDGAVYNPMA